jgi:hypothetical protein
VSYCCHGDGPGESISDGDLPIAILNLDIHPAFKWLWASSCQSKHKIFFWLLLKDRVSTRELLRRKNMDLQDFSCVLCSALVEESLVHLFLECPFDIQCWDLIGVKSS